MLTTSKEIIIKLCQKGWLNFLPDKLFLKIMFYVRMGKKLNLKHPKTYNEKLQWLKLHDRKPEYTDMVDKCCVKKYVAQQIGEEYIIPTLGVWEQFDDIDFDDLPNQFVLKCTHDSGSVVICRNKEAFDFQQASAKLQKQMNTDFFKLGREWPYKNVTRRIIAEQYMQDGTRRELRDYKFYCFNGVPRFLYISEGLENYKTARISFVDIENGKWEFAPFKRTDFMEFEELPPKPDTYDEMFRIAEILSKDYPFVRVDVYEINGNVYLSEMTFTPGAGFTEYEPNEWNYRLGDMITLPRREKE